MENNITEQENIKTKSKIKAGILAILFGFLGIHNFYLGYKKKAIIQLLIGGLFFILGTVWLVFFLIVVVSGILTTILSQGILFVFALIVIDEIAWGGLLYLGCAPTMIWAWIEAILIFSGKIDTDAKGNFLK